LYGKKKIELATEVIRKKRSLAYAATRIFFYPLIYFARKLASSKNAVLGDKERDALEYYLIEKALEKNLPILGICRGAQMINVFTGGTLFQDLSQFYSETPQYHSIFPRKNVRLSPHSRLAAICKTRRMKVNALHRQAIDRTGENMRVVAMESTGVVQAIEHIHRPFVIGVQWHPEFLPQHSVHQAVFIALVHACRAKSK
jgi:putative glutamine amidotransferase